MKCLFVGLGRVQNVGNVTFCSHEYLTFAFLKCHQHFYISLALKDGTTQHTHTHTHTHLNTGVWFALSQHIINVVFV